MITFGLGSDRICQIFIFSQMKIINFGHTFCFGWKWNLWIWLTANHCCHCHQQFTKITELMISSVASNENDYTSCTSVCHLMLYSWDAEVS